MARLRRARIQGRSSRIWRVRGGLLIYESPGRARALEWRLDAVTGDPSRFGELLAAVRQVPWYTPAAEAELIAMRNGAPK